MKKQALNFHRNVAAPRSPFPDKKITTQKEKILKRSASNTKKFTEKSGSKQHSTRGKSSKGLQSPSEKDRFTKKRKTCTRN